MSGYNAWREFCGLERVRTLRDFQKVVGHCGVAEKILDTYGHPDNIDVWLGGLVEKFLPGARTGPLFACLIGRQMKAVRDGDRSKGHAGSSLQGEEAESDVRVLLRFWWEAEGVFSQRQKAALLKGSLSRVICDNTDIHELLPDSFIFRPYPYGYTSCLQLPSVNLEAWKEEMSQGGLGKRSPLPCPRLYRSFINN